MASKDTYRTISGQSEGLYKEKGSKFIAFASPVESHDDITEVLESLKKQYHDARHHCYAWILGTEGNEFRANDDGEPSHSAGDPILGQIRARSLTNTLIAVVRYFGGTKLGVGGLIHAYRTAAAAALDNNTIIEKAEKVRIGLRYGYDKTSPVMRIIEETGGDIVYRQFDASCTLQVTIRKGLMLRFLKKIQRIDGVLAEKMTSF